MPRGMTQDEIQAKENQKRLFIMIFAILALVTEIGLGGWGMYKAKEIQEGEGIQSVFANGLTNINKMNDLLVTEQDRVAELDNSLMAYSQPVGWRLKVVSSITPHRSRAHDPEQLKWFLDQMIDTLVKVHGTDDMEKIHNLELKGRFVKWSDKDGDKTKRLTLDKLYPVLISLRAAYRKAAQDHEAIADTKHGEERAAWATAFQEVETAKGDLTAPTQQLQDQLRAFLASEQTHHDELNQAQAQFETAKLDLDQETRTIATKTEDKLARLNELKSRIRLAKHQQAEAEERREADSRVIAADEAVQMAYIDLTLRDRVFPGTEFRVFRILKGGVRVEKGVIEIYEVGERFTTVRIRADANGIYPKIKEDDQIYNEFYERGRPRHVVFAGTFTGPYSQQDLIAQMNDNGDRHQETIDEKTSLLIVGEGFEKDPVYLKAADSGIRILTEKFFYAYLGLTYTSRSD